MAEACRALSLPVIGGNVSLYNESGGADIDPTPVLGVLGLVDAVTARPPGRAWSSGDTVVLLGARSAPDGSFPLEGTRWATERRDHRTGDVPAVDFAAHATLCAFVAGLVAAQVGGAVGDGAWCTPCTTCRGAASRWRWPRWRRRPAPVRARRSPDAAELFTELPSRFVVATAGPRRAVCPGRPPSGIPAAVLGRAGGDRFALGGAGRPPARGPARGRGGQPGPWPWANPDGTGLCENGHAREGSVRCLRCLRARNEGGQPHLRRALRPAAPGPGVGRHGGQRRRHRHRRQGHGPGGHGLRRAHALGIGTATSPSATPATRRTAPRTGRAPSPSTGPSDGPASRSGTTAT